MPYSPTVWLPNDEVTSARQNKIEQGVQTAQAAAESAQAAVDNLTAIVNAIGTGGGGGGSGSTVSSTAGAVSLWSFPGATPDAKMTNALSYIAAQTVTTPPLLMSPDPAAGSGSVGFSQAGRQIFNGLKVVYPYGFGNQQRAAESIPCDVRYSGTGSWWVLPSGNTYDVEFSGIGFQGNSGSTFLDGSSGGVLWTSKFHDLGFNLWKHVMGTPTAKLLMTACLWSGWWNINNSYNTAISVGGSDCNLFTEGALIDSPTAFMGTSNPGNYHVRLDRLQKSSVGPIYMTNEKVSGIWIDTGSTEGALILNGSGRSEGRNNAQPCWGSNMRIGGSGQVTIRDWWVAYGMSNPNQNGHTGEGGVITQTGARVLYDGLIYDRADGVAETVPFIFVSGGTARVRNIQTANRGGGWTGLPRVDQAGGTVDADSSVTVI